MPHRPHFRPSFVVSLPLLVALGFGPGCKDDPAKKDAATAADPVAEPKADDGAAPVKADGEGDGSANADGGGGLADTVRDAIPKDTPIPVGSSSLPARGDALGWVIMRNFEGTLGKIKTQLMPAKYAAYGDIATLRAMAGMLGEKAKVVQHTNFAEPAGCVLLNDTAIKAPVACFFSYEGGGAAVSTDVGDGKQADAKGHVAYHVIEGQDLFVDDLGTAVVVTTTAGLFDKSKAYLSDTLLPHAKVQGPDLAMVAFPDALMERYDTDLSALMAMAGPSGASAVDVYRDIDSFEYGFALEPDGAHLRMGIGVKPGSKYAELWTSMYSGPVDPKWFATLPASTWAVTAYNARISKLRENDAMKAMTTMVDTALESYASETGKDAATVRASITAFLDETTELYGSSASWGLMHEPGTTGAAYLVLAKAAPGREKWKTWSESFSAENVLDKDSLKDVGWSFKADAATVDGVPADRWTIDVKKVADPDIAKVAKRFGGKLELTIDRFELDQTVIFVAALSDIDKVDAAMIAASKGTATLAEAPGGKAFIALAGPSMGSFGLDAKRMFAWLTEVVPEGAPYPAVGVDLTDATFITTSDTAGYKVDMAMSQPVLDQIKALIP